jgi:hypothetical protein
MQSSNVDASTVRFCSAQTQAATIHRERRSSGVGLLAQRQRTLTLPSWKCCYALFAIQRIKTKGDAHLISVCQRFANKRRDLLYVSRFRIVVGKSRRATSKQGFDLNERLLLIVLALILALIAIRWIWQALPK